MHDPYLSRISNVKQFSEFNTRYEYRKYPGLTGDDWWTDRFTLAELKRLAVKQDQAPGRISIFDYKLTFPTLGEVI